MPMFMYIDEDRIILERGYKCRQGFEELDGKNASHVMGVLFGAYRDDPEQYEHRYKALKRGVQIGVLRDDEYADALIFAGTGIIEQVVAGSSMGVHPGDVYMDWHEAEQENEEFDLLYS